MTDHKRTGPLADLTIIDCTMAYAGPFVWCYWRISALTSSSLNHRAATILGRFLRFRRIMNTRTNTRVLGSTMACLDVAGQSVGGLV
jgi:hypothetical protein